MQGIVQQHVLSLLWFAAGFLTFKLLKLFPGTVQGRDLLDG